MSDGSYLEPRTLLAALARATGTMRLGTLVALLVPRHPTLLAGHVLTVDQISEGRVELGIGAGDVPTDSGAFGTAQWSAGERVERLEDQLQLLDMLLRGQSVTSTGRHYSVAGPICRNRCNVHGRLSLSLRKERRVFGWWLVMLMRG